MQIAEILWILISLLAGTVLGWFFFAGLRLTVDRLATVKHPWLLMSASYILRTLVVVVAFYFIMDGHLPRLLVCLLGFILARTLLIKRVQKQPTA